MSVDIGHGMDRSQRLLRQRVQDRWSDAYAPARHLDGTLMVVALALAAFGVVMIYSAKLHELELQGLPSTFYATQQLIALGVGVVGMAVVAAIDYRFARIYSALLYLLGILGLLLVLSPLGVEVNGAQAWLAVGGVQFQPSELAKVGAIVGLAALLHVRREQPGLVTVMLCLVLAAVPVGLIMLQPDLGSAVVFVWVAFVLLVVGGVRWRYLVLLAVLAAVGVAGTVHFGILDDHQVARITSFLDPTNDQFARTIRYNADQSIIAVGSGQLVGKGLFNGTQTSLSYVPENHTDFIFTVVAEELGFVGGAVLLGLFLLLIWRGLRIAVLARDRFGMLLAAGTVALLLFQVFVNIGMAIGLMPVIGIPLPFVSYGGTSLIANFLLVGLLLNVHMRRF